MACHNPETGALEAVCKCEHIGRFLFRWSDIDGRIRYLWSVNIPWRVSSDVLTVLGFTDQFYKDLLKRYPPNNEIPEKCNTDNTLGYYETNGLRPDVWFSPDEVWEMRGAE